MTCIVWTPKVTFAPEDVVLLPIQIACCNIRYVVSFNCSSGQSMDAISSYANLELPSGK